MMDIENSEQCDLDRNSESHREFIAFVREHTNTKVDRIRLHSLRGGGLLICMDSWNCRLGTHAHWMSENFPTLSFCLEFMQDTHSHDELIFEHGKWVWINHYTPDPTDGVTSSQFCAAGRIGDYNDRKESEQCSVESLDDDLRAFANTHLGNRASEVCSLDRIGVEYTALHRKAGEATIPPQLLVEGQVSPASICDNDAHRWIVFSTALQENWLMLNCRTCGAMGTVNDPSSNEWSAAHCAPSKPYDWSDNSRVTLRQSGPVYVSTASSTRSPGKVLVPHSPLSNEERDELRIFEDLVIEAELDGSLFPLYIRSFQDDTGVEPTGAVKQIAAQIEALVDRGRVFTPAMIGIVIREYVRESDHHPPTARIPQLRIEGVNRCSDESERE